MSHGPQSFDSTDLDIRVQEIIRESTNDTPQNSDVISPDIRTSSIKAALRRFSDDCPRRVQELLTGNGSSFYQLTGSDSDLALGNKWERDWSKIDRVQWPFDNTIATSERTPLLNILNESEYYVGPAQTAFYTALRLDGNGYADGTGTGIYNTATSVIVVRFRRGEPLGEGNNRHLVGTGDDTYSIRFDTGDGIIIRLGGTALSTIALSTYQPYYKEDHWNTLEVSGTSGSTIVTLNGVIIGQITTAWTPSDPATFVAGATSTGATPFLGDIDYIRIYSDAAKTTQVEGYEFASYAAEISTPTRDLTARGAGNQIITEGPREADQYLVFVAAEPTTTENLAVQYTAVHEVQGLNGSKITTVPFALFEAVAILGAWQCAMTLVSRYAHTTDSLLGADTTNYQDKADVWRRIATSLMARYKTFARTSAEFVTPKRVPLWSSRTQVRRNRRTRLGFPRG